jgi:hypothetical protein
MPTGKALHWNVDAIIFEALCEDRSLCRSEPRSLLRRIADDEVGGNGDNDSEEALDCVRVSYTGKCGESLPRKM